MRSTTFEAVGSSVAEGLRRRDTRNAGRHWRRPTLLPPTGSVTSSASEILPVTESNDIDDEEEVDAEEIGHINLLTSQMVFLFPTISFDGNQPILDHQGGEHVQQGRQ